MCWSTLDPPPVHLLLGHLLSHLTSQFRAWLLFDYRPLHQTPPSLRADADNPLVPHIALPTSGVMSPIRDRGKDSQQDHLSKCFNSSCLRTVFAFLPLAWAAGTRFILLLSPGACSVVPEAFLAQSYSSRSPAWALVWVCKPHLTLPELHAQTKHGKNRAQRF